MSHIDGVDDGVGYGVHGKTVINVGVSGLSDSGIGVCGRSNSGFAILGVCPTNVGVYGQSDSGFGITGTSETGFGLYGYSSSGYAAYLDGSVYIHGPLQKPGGQFKIDHPLDPANKYLCHSLIESPDMKNVYD